MIDISHINNFLLCETPEKWVDHAITDIPLLLTDHANCELKAAQTAQSLMWKYGLQFNPDQQNSQSKKSKLAQLNSSYRYHDTFELLNKMSRLAREELKHFEQVIAIMKKRNIDYYQIDAANYAGELRRSTRSNEPDKLVDTLIVGAIIEARSCERFAKIAPFLDDELQHFYTSLLKSESRHFQDYLRLAKSAFDHYYIDNSPYSLDDRVKALLEVEQTLILTEEEVFRFHSGPISV